MYNAFLFLVDVGLGEEEEEEELFMDFTPSTGLTTKEAEALLLVHGRNELEEQVTHPLVVFLGLLFLLVLY